MKYSRIISLSLVSASIFVFSACFHQNQGTLTNTTATGEAVETINSNIVTQVGLVTTFPTADLPIIDRVEVLTSLRNETAESSVTHEAEYISDTLVGNLYAEYKKQLERVGWIEQNPQDQQVGALQIMSGTFVREQDTISIAIQTAVGTEKEIGATKILLKIEQVQ